MFTRSRGVAENIHWNNRSLVCTLKPRVHRTPPRLRGSARAAFFRTGGQVSELSVR